MRPSPPPGRGRPRPGSRCTGGPPRRVGAARQYSGTSTANIAMFAIAAHADEREAHIREVERSGQNLPEGSYGRRNRQAIAGRETRIAARLRAVEHAYRMAIERDVAFSPPERTRACH